jgi:hypothetical protein
MNLRHTPPKSETFEELHMLLEYHKLVLEDAYKLRDRSLETINELKVKIVSKQHNLKIGMTVYAFHTNDDRLSFLEGDNALAHRAEITEISPCYDLKEKPHLVIKYLDESSGTLYKNNIYQVYSYWEHIKD